MMTPDSSAACTMDEEHKREVNQISGLVFEELGRLRKGKDGGIADLSKSIEMLHNILDQVKADCIANLRCRAREHNATVLINRRLPPEILGEIILFAICSEGERYYARLYDFRSVSKYWNDVIKSTPTLWTVLDWVAIQKSGCRTVTNLMDNAIRRSGTLPLHVMVQPVTLGDSFLWCTLKTSSRWHDANVSLVSDAKLDFIRHPSFPNLVTLTVREFPCPTDIDKVGRCIRPCGTFPSLQRLRTDVVLLRPPDGFAALRTLIIEPAPSRETLIIPCMTLPKYLDCCPNLEELRVFNVLCYEGWTPLKAKELKIRLPHLHTLTIWDCDLDLIGSLLLGLREHSCRKLFVNLVGCEESGSPEWQHDVDVFELLGCFVPLIQNSCKEVNCVELVLAPDQFQLRTQMSASDTAGAAQSIVICLADIAKPQTIKALLDLLGLRDRAPPFEVHLRVSLIGDQFSTQVRRFKEEILLPVLEWPSISSLSIDMDNPNALVFLADLRKPLRSGIWPLPSVTKLFLDDMDIEWLSEELRLLYKWRLDKGDNVAPLQSIVIESGITWEGIGWFKLLESVPP